jgi:hypothetical protein
MSAEPKGGIVWHSPAEMLPQVGQETWILLVSDCGRVIRKAKFISGGYGTDAAWSPSPGITIVGGTDIIRGWCPKEAINTD